MCFEDDEENPCCVGFPRRLSRCGGSGTLGTGICSVYPAALLLQCSWQEPGLSSSFHSVLEHPCLPQCAETGIIALGNSRIMPWNDADSQNPCGGAFFSPLSGYHLLELLSNPLPTSSISMEEPNGKHPQDAVFAFVMARIPCGMLQLGWV